MKTLTKDQGGGEVEAQARPIVPLFIFRKGFGMGHLGITFDEHAITLCKEVTSAACAREALVTCGTCLRVARERKVTPA